MGNISDQMMPKVLNWRIKLNGLVATHINFLFTLMIVSLTELL